MTEPRSLATIANEIRADWSVQGKGINYAARPYLNAMAYLNKPTDSYGADDAKTIVIYFLSNATSWKGDVARRVKLELKKMFNIK